MACSASWVTNRAAAPCASRPAITVSTRRVESGSRPDVGSSSKRTFGSMARARARARRCRSPVESRLTGQSKAPVASDPESRPNRSSRGAAVSGLVK